MELLTGKDYMHPLEEEAKEQLLACLGSEGLVGKLYEFYRVDSAASQYLQALNKGILVSSKQFSHIDSMVKSIGEQLGLEPVPVYIMPGLEAHVDVKGLEKPWLEISSGALRLYSEQELEFMVARQLAHIKLGHMECQVLYESFLRFVNTLSQWSDLLISKIPIVGAIKDSLSESYIWKIKVAGARWSRISEYSADNYALAICRWQVKLAFKAILKQSLQDKDLAEQVNLKEYLKQADLITKCNYSAVQGVVEYDTYPGGALRLKELLGFINRVL